MRRNDVADGVLKFVEESGAAQSTGELDQATDVLISDVEHVALRGMAFVNVAGKTQVSPITISGQRGLCTQVGARPVRADGLGPGTRNGENRN